MKFGLRYCNTGRFIDSAHAVELIVAAEEAGFDSAWTVEHTVIPELHASKYPYSKDGRMAGDRYDLPLPDPLIWMAYVAAHTTRIKLGTGILILPQHNPVVVAKQIATLDLMSGSRVLLGIGVGWMREEFQVLGLPPFEERGAVTDEYIRAFKELWTEDDPHFEGKYISFDDISFLPKPVQKPHPPILIGGSSVAARQRVARFGDGWHTLRQTPRQFAKGRADIFERTEIAGRDASALRFSLSIPIRFTDTPPSAPVMDRTALTGTNDDIAETINAYKIVGLDEIVLGISSAEMNLNIKTMERFMHDVVPRL